MSETNDIHRMTSIIGLLTELNKRCVQGKRKKKPYDLRVEIIRYDLSVLQNVNTNVNLRIPCSMGGETELIHGPNPLSFKHIKLKAQGKKIDKFYNINCEGAKKPFVWSGEEWIPQNLTPVIEINPIQEMPPGPAGAEITYESDV